jgi:peptidoglycan/xylan/chitin deacetylase (PgdA/CDA1 family)
LPRERDQALQGLPRANLSLGRPLRRPELLQLAREPGITIGAHTVSHPRLSRLPRARQRDELALSRAALAAATGRPVDLLSYPFGKQDDVSDETRALAAAAGYAAAFSSIPGALQARSDRYMLPRMSVHEWSVEEFAARTRHHLGTPRRS